MDASKNKPTKRKRTCPSPMLPSFNNTSVNQYESIQQRPSKSFLLKTTKRMLATKSTKSTKSTRSSHRNETIKF